MKKCSKAFKKKVLGYTNKIYEDCVREVLGLKNETPEQLKEAMDMVRMAHDMYIIHGDAELKEYIKAQKEVSDLYIVKILQMPTKQLNEIIKAHNSPGGIRRRPRTLEAILDELTRRSIFGDSNESDFNNNNGEVDVNGPTKKSKSSSTKAAVKRRKTSKNR